MTAMTDGDDGDGGDDVDDGDDGDDGDGDVHRTRRVMVGEGREGETSTTKKKFGGGKCGREG